MNNLPAAQSGNFTQLQVNWENPEVIKALKQTLAQGLTDAEFMLYAEHCKATRLNPFKKEVWAVKGKSYTNNRGEHVEGKLQIMTGINGFFAIANSNPLFDGEESGLIDPSGDYKSQAYPGDNFIGAWCKVYRKDRRVPIEGVAMLSEYDKSTDPKYSQGGIWRSMKRVMIIKCAQSVALRKSFPQELNGLYTAEEMPPEFSQPTQAQQEAKQPEVLPAQKHYYDLANYPVDRIEKLVKNLIGIGATQINDTTWESPKKVRNLEVYEITEEQALSGGATQ